MAMAAACRILQTFSVPSILWVVLLIALFPKVESATKCSETCTSGGDCPSDSECVAVGHPDNPGTKHCLCKEGFYGDPFVDAGADVPRCRERNYYAAIFGQRKGCFKVDKTARKVTRAAGDYRHYKLNTYSCRETCSDQDTALAVLQEGDLCFCADLNTDTLTKADSEDDCNSNCTEPDPEGNKCGGFHDLEDGVVTKSFSNIYTTQKGVTSVFFTTLEKKQKTGVATLAVVDFTPPEGFCKPLMNFVFDFGTGAGFTYPHRNTYKEWKYAVPGSYIVTGQADGRFPVLDATRISVSESVSKEGIIARCEEYYRFGEKANCSVSTILGTGLMVDIFWGPLDRKEFEYSRVEDPYHCFAGDSVMQHINCADYQDAKYENYRPEEEYMFTGGMLVNPMSEFACEGILKGFEFFVKADSAAPALKFKLYRPKCDPGLHWCYDAMECVPESEECLPPNSHSCEGAYCQMSGSCSDTCAATDRSQAFEKTPYEPVPDAEWTVTDDSAGTVDWSGDCNVGCGCYGVFRLNLGTFEEPDHFRVYPGYLLVMEPAGAKVYYTVDTTSSNNVYVFSAGASSIQGGDISEKQAETGIKWAFQGFLAQYSAINLTNNLQAPYFDKSYLVEIWVTADSFADAEDSKIKATIDDVAIDELPVYYYTFEVNCHYGFDNITVKTHYEYSPYAEANEKYEITVGLDTHPDESFSAYEYGTLLNITWGDETDTSDDKEKMLFDEAKTLGHQYKAEGVYEICVAAYNNVSHDTECWNVTVMNPVLEGKYNFEFDPVAVGCGCGEEPYLGSGDGVLTVRLAAESTQNQYFEDNFPTDAKAYITLDTNVKQEQSLVKPASGLPADIVFSHTYSEPGCRNVTLSVSNYISSIRETKEICVYQRISGTMIESLFQVHPGQIASTNPIPNPIEVFIGDAAFIRNDYYTRFKINQTSEMVNQTFLWTWGDESDPNTEETIGNPIALHLFKFNGYGLSASKALTDDASVRISNPLQNDETGPNAAIKIDLKVDGKTITIALAPTQPEIRTPSSVWGTDNTVEVTFAFQERGWKTCCFTYCEGCTEPLAFLQSSYDADDLNNGLNGNQVVGDQLTKEQEDEAEANLEKGYNACNNQDDYTNPWHNADAELHMINNQRLDLPDGYKWSGWGNPDQKDGQEKLTNRVLAENVIVIKPFFGIAQQTYKLNYYCWNPISFVSSTYEFIRKDPVTCSFPTINIDFRGPEVFNPTPLYRKDRNFITGNVILNCEETDKNTKWWTCQKFSEETGKSDGDPFYPHMSGNTTAELIIPRKGLDYGVYKCTLYVRMDLTYLNPVYANSAFTYIKILPYKLLGQMYYSITTLDIGYDQSVELDPGTFSKDLDLDGGEFVQFKWFGKCGNEEYPRTADNKLDESDPPPPVEGKQPGLMGGIEGNGPGRIKGDDSKLIVVPKDLKGMRSNLTCEIMSHFKKRPDQFDRDGVAIIILNIMENAPPTVKIRTGNGTLAEPTITPDQRPAQKINPIGTFRAKSECTGLTDCDKVNFEWFMGCLAIDLVPPIDYKNMDNYDNITLDDDPEIQPIESLRVNRFKENVGIPMALVKHFVGNDSVDCILRLKVCNNRDEADIQSGTAAACGFAALNLQLNLPPRGGNASVVHNPNMAAGNCLENYMFHLFTFHNWEDPDDKCIKSYTIIQMTGDGIMNIPLEEELASIKYPLTSQNVLYSGPENPYNEKIKYGNKQFDWATVFCVRVNDCLGSYVFYCFKSRFEKVPVEEMVTCQEAKPATFTPPAQAPITATPIPSSILEPMDNMTFPETTKIRELLTDDPYALEKQSKQIQDLVLDAIEKNFTKYIAEQSNRNITSFVQAAMDQLNLLIADLDEEMEEIQVGIDFMGSQMETMLGPEEKAEFDIILAKKQAEKQKIVEYNEFLKGEIMHGLATGVPELNTPELIAAMASSTSSSTQNTDELSEGGLSSGMDLVKKIGGNFADQITDIDQETADGITQSGLGGVANILIGGRDLSERSTNQQSNESQAAGPMPDDSVEPIGEMPPPVAGNVMESGHEMLNVVDQIGFGSQQNKVADEPDAELTQENMGVRLTKKEASQVIGENGLELAIKSSAMVQAPKVLLPSLEMLLDGLGDSDNPDPPSGIMASQAIQFMPGAFRKPAMFGTPGDYLVGDSCMFRIVLSTDESNKKIEVPEAREAIDLHLPKEGAKTIKQNFKRQKGWMELGSDHQFILTEFDVEHDVALSVYAKYYKQVIDHWICVYVRYGQAPFHDPYLDTWEYDFLEVLPRKLTRSEKKRHEGEQYPDANVFLIENHRLRDTGKYFIGIRPCRKNFDWDYFDTPIISNKVFPSDFEFNFWTQSCMAMSENGKDYETRGCVVGSMSNAYNTECMCMHLTSFAGSMAPPPPALDFSKMSFKWDDMYPVYTVLIALWLLYILLMLWARRQDRKDIAKLGFTPLPDNDPNDYYMYEMAIQTGMVKGAGTKSKVYFYVVGDLGRSRIHVVEDPYRSILKRDSKDLFLLSTPKSLGRLTNVRFWHDNSGVGDDQNWFCDYIALRDVQTGEKTFFMAYRWWSLVNDDGLIDRIVERTEPENMKQFRFMFASKTREKLNDGHLYYSIFARPVESHFTRCQRCSCAMCILLLEFCVSAMYYQTRQEVDESTTVWVGPIKFNIAELGVSMMSTAFVLPLSLLVVQLFRRTKPFMTPDEEDIDELDAEEEMESASKRKKREEERKKREEKKKAELAKYFGAGAANKMRRGSADSQAGLTGNMEQLDGSASRTSSRSEHSSASNKSSLKQPGSTSQSSSSSNKNVQIKDEPQVASVSEDGALVPEDLGELSISESSSESEYETDDDDLDLDCYDRMRKSKWFCCLQCIFGWGDKRKRGPFMLPASFLYINWILVFIILLGATAIIAMYAAMIAFQGGSALVGKWVVSMIGSIFMSIFLVQPLKILLLAVILSLLCQRRVKRKDDDEIMEELTEEELRLMELRENTFDKDKHLYGGEEVGDIIVGKLPDEEFLDEENEMAKSKRKLLPGELTRQKKSSMRIWRNKEIAMFAVVREICLYLIFTWFLFSACYIEKDATGFYLYKEVKDVLFEGDGLSSVSDIDGYWDYLIDHFVPNMYSLEWYNNDRPLGLYGYFGDKVNLVIGYSVIRQLRVRKDLCLPYKIGRHNISRECIPPFAAEYEDRGRYGPGWVRFDANNPYHILREEYRYVDSEEIDGYPFWGQSATYPGGGFLVRLDGNKEDSIKKLKQLKNEKFIDHYTRAILHEFAIYNPTYNLFAVVTMLSEFRASSGMFAYYYCDPLRLIMYHGPTAPYQILVQIGLGVFLVGFMFRDGRRIYKQRKEFFTKTWNVVDALIDVMGVVAIVIFMYRYTKTEEAMRKVSLLGGRQFVNLNFLVMVSLVYLMVIGLICFASTVRFLKILNFNKKISMFRDVLVTCREDLTSFAVMFVILQAGFVTMAYLFFGNFLVRYSTPFQTQQSLFNMLLGKFSFEELIQVDANLGAIFFMSYSNCMMLITMNIFVVILDSSVGDVNEGLAEKSNEYEILNFLGGRMKFWVLDTLGVAKKTVSDIKHRKEIEERRTLDSKIEDLPHKFNHLVDLINDRYFDGQEVFHIQVSDYKDIRALEKARKKAPREIKPEDMEADNEDEESSDEEMYANMTSDFNTLIPMPKSAAVKRKSHAGGSARR